MSLQNIKQMKEERGFTLVEHLIVIVIIAILAAIIIVAYNGITARAHSSAAQQAAQNIVNKAEAYNAENGAYPSSISAFGTDTTKSYYLSTNAYTQQTTAFGTSFTGKDDTVTFTYCNTGAGTNTVGDIVGYWNFAGNAPATLTAGTATPGAVIASGTVACTLATN